MWHNFRFLCRGLKSPTSIDQTIAEQQRAPKITRETSSRIAGNGFRTITTDVKNSRKNEYTRYREIEKEKIMKEESTNLNKKYLKIEYQCVCCQDKAALARNTREELDTKSTTERVLTGPSGILRYVNRGRTLHIRVLQSETAFLPSPTKQVFTVPYRSHVAYFFL